jgi:hypothetical protein
LDQSSPKTNEPSPIVASTTIGNSSNKSNDTPTIDEDDEVLMTKSKSIKSYLLHTKSKVPKSAMSNIYCNFKNLQFNTDLIIEYQNQRPIIPFTSDIFTHESLSVAPMQSLKQASGCTSIRDFLINLYKPVQKSEASKDSYRFVVTGHIDIIYKIKLYHPDHTDDYDSVSEREFALVDYITKPLPKYWLLRYIFFTKIESNFFFALSKFIKFI